MTEKEKLNHSQNEIKDLLTDFLEEVKKMDNPQIDNLKNQLSNLEDQVKNLDVTDTKNIENFMSNIEKELQALQEYTEFKNLLNKLKENVSNIEKEVIKPTKNDLNELKQNVAKLHNLDPNNLSSEQIKQAAKVWRKKHSQVIANIAKNLAEKNIPFISWLAKKV